MDNRIALQILEEMTNLRKAIELAGKSLINFEKIRVDIQSNDQVSMEEQRREARVQTASANMKIAPIVAESKEIPKDVIPSEVIATDTDPAPWLNIAHNYVDEIDENDPKGFEQIQKWGQLIGFNVSDPSVPWCGVFAGGILEEAGIKSVRSARARDYATQGDKCEPKPGALWVGQSHVAFIDNVHDDGSIDILGGNQSNKCCIQQARFYGEPIAIVWPESK